MGEITYTRGSQRTPSITILTPAPVGTGGQLIQNNIIALANASLPPGGSQGQILQKSSDADYDVSWIPASSNQGFQGAAGPQGPQGSGGGGSGDVTVGTAIGDVPQFTDDGSGNPQLTTPELGIGQSLYLDSGITDGEFSVSGSFINSGTSTWTSLFLNGENSYYISWNGTYWILTSDSSPYDLALGSTPTPGNPSGIYMVSNLPPDLTGQASSNLSMLYLQFFGSPEGYNSSNPFYNHWTIGWGGSATTIAVGGDNPNDPTGDYSDSGIGWNVTACTIGETENPFIFDITAFSATNPETQQVVTTNDVGTTIAFQNMPNFSGSASVSSQPALTVNANGNVNTIGTTNLVQGLTISDKYGDTVSLCQGGESGAANFSGVVSFQSTDETQNVSICGEEYTVTISNNNIGMDCGVSFCGSNTIIYATDYINTLNICDGVNAITIQQGLVSGLGLVTDTTTPSANPLATGRLWFDGSDLKINIANQNLILTESWGGLYFAMGEYTVDHVDANGNNVYTFYNTEQGGHYTLACVETSGGDGNIWTWTLTNDEGTAFDTPATTLSAGTPGNPSGPYYRWTSPDHSNYDGYGVFYYDSDWNSFVKQDPSGNVNVLGNLTAINIAEIVYSTEQTVLQDYGSLDDMQTATQQAGACLYRVSYYLNTYTYDPTAGTAYLYFSWEDDSNITQNVTTSINLALAGSMAQGTFMAFVTSTNGLRCNPTATNYGTSAAWSFYIAVEKLNGGG